MSRNEGSRLEGSYNLCLKDEIRKRVARICLTLNAEMLSAPDSNRTIVNVRPGKGKIVAQITFTNGAVKWAVIEKDHAVLLS